MKLTATYSYGTLKLSVWGHGTSCALENIVNGESVHWQGDEAGEILDRLDCANCFSDALEAIWGEYEHIAE